MIVSELIAELAKYDGKAEVECKVFLGAGIMKPETLNTVGDKVVIYGWSDI